MDARPPSRSSRFDSLFFGGAAQIVLVSPVDIYSTLNGGIPSFAILSLNDVPEPGAALMAGRWGAGDGTGGEVARPG